MKKLLFFASAVALLASCSKDMTEDVFVEAPSISGNNKIIASYETDGETRSHLEGVTSGWDNGDALGVFAYNATTKADASNAMFGLEKKGATNDEYEFTGDLMSVKGTKFIVYYPWSEGKKINADGTFALTIPEVQKYNHKFAKKGEAGVGYGSYSAGVTPALAIAELTEEQAKDKANAVLEANLKPAVAWVSVPFTGIGKVSKMELNVKLGNTEKRIAGTFNVDLFKPSMKYQDGVLTEEEDVFYTIPATSTYEPSIKTITLDCGDGVELDQEDKTWFVFTIPAIGPLNKETLLFTFTVYGEEDTVGTKYEFPIDRENYVVARNTFVRLSSADFVWVESGKYLVQNPAQFVEYAYAATNGTDEVPAKHDMIKEDGNLKTALITKNLPFTDYTYAVAVAEDNEFYKFQKAVADWYTKNGGIESIGGKAKYAIEGRVEVEGATAPAAATITGLKVNATQGIFTATAALPASVKNIVLDGAVVTTTVDENGAAYFLAENMWYFSTDVTDATKGANAIENVVVKGGTITAAAGATLKSASVLQKIQSIFLAKAETMVKVETAVTDAPNYAAVLDVYTSAAVEITDAYTTEDGEILFEAVVPQYSEIDGEENVGAIVTVANAAVAKSLISKIDATPEYAKSQDGEKNGWFSVKDKANVYYWTGLYPNAADNGDKIVTAEELAYAVANHEYKTTLTNDLNLMGDAGKMWPVTTLDKGYQIEGKNKTISNVLVATTDINKNYYYAMFGTSVNVTNLTVDGLTIELPRAYTSASAYVAGIAYQSTRAAKNTGITVKNLEFKLKDNKNFNGNAVGGIFALDTDKGNYAEGCSVANVTGIPADVAYGDIYGAVNVKLAVTSDAVIDIPGNTVENDPIGEVRCTGSTNMDTFQSTNFKFGYTSEQVPFSIFKFISTKEYPIKDGHSLWIEWTDTKTTERYVKADQVVDDFTLGEALAEAEKGATVNVKKGNYGAFPNLKDLAEDLNIVCEPGTVFEGYIEAEGNTKTVDYFNGATIENATFDGGNGELMNGYTRISGTFKNCTFKGTKAMNGRLTTGEDVIFEGCTFESTATSGNNMFAIHFDAADGTAQDATKVILNGCTIKGWAAFPGAGNVDTEATGCFFGPAAINYVEIWGDATFTNCEFTYNGSETKKGIGIFYSDKYPEPNVEFNGCTVNGAAFAASNIDEGFKTANVTIK